SMIMLHSAARSQTSLQTASSSGYIPARNRTDDRSVKACVCPRGLAQDTACAWPIHRPGRRGHDFVRALVQESATRATAPVDSSKRAEARYRIAPMEAAR